MLVVSSDGRNTSIDYCINIHYSTISQAEYTFADILEASPYNWACRDFHFTGVYEIPDSTRRPSSRKAKWSLPLRAEAEGIEPLDGGK